MRMTMTAAGRVAASSFKMVNSDVKEEASTVNTNNMVFRKTPYPSNEVQQRPELGNDDATNAYLFAGGDEMSFMKKDELLETVVEVRFTLVRRVPVAHIRSAPLKSKTGGQ